MDLGTAFSDLKPLLFHALGRLARQGFAVAPTDGIDLIHDFLTDELSGLRRRYESDKGGFKTYAYRAFVQFARPRIVRLQRLQESLVNPEVLVRLSGSAAAEIPEFSPDYLQHLAEAIDTLPPDERGALRTYISSNAPSERLLAQGLGVSRYQARDLLIRALGRVVIQLAKPPGVTEHDWHVAHALWHDQRTINEAAAYLNLTPGQVRSAQAKVTKFLENTLRNMQPLRRYTRRRKMKAERYNIPARTLLAETLKARGDQDLLQQLRDRSDEVIASLDADDYAMAADGELLDVDFEWLAAVYEALAGKVEVTREEQKLFDALFEAGIDEETSVGEAFEQILWPDLPDALRDPDRWFPESARVSSVRLKESLQEPSVKSGWAVAAQLAVYGVTPMTIFHATEAVSSALERMQDYGLIDARSPVRLSADRAEASGDERGVLTLESLVAEIHTSAKCDKAIARSLYSWLINVAQYKPFIFDGFESEAVGEGVLLRRIDDSSGDLFQRWRSQRTGARAVEALIEERPVSVEIEWHGGGASAGEEHVQMKSAAAAAGARPSSGSVYLTASGELSTPHQIAVLMPPDDSPGEEYLKQGIASGIARSLSLLPTLAVKLPYHTSLTRAQVEDVKAIQAAGHALGVRAVLAGLVEPAENHFRCTTRFVEIGGSEIWHKLYEPSYADITRVEDDISRMVASFFGVALPDEHAESPGNHKTEDPDAQKLYMAGRFHWSQWSPSGFRSAIKCYERALSKDPDFSLAYAGQADCYNVLPDYTSKSPRSALTKAKAAAYEALEYGESLPEAYASLAYAHTRYYWRWEEAEGEFRRALKINPSYAVARQWYAEHLTALGRFDEAINQVKLAQEFEPNSPIINAALGATYYFARQYPSALEQFHEALKGNPQLSRAHFGLGIVYAQAGAYDDAIRVLREATRLFPESIRGLAALAHVYALSGLAEQARRILQELSERPKQQFVSPYSLALVHTALGEDQAALDKLSSAVEHKDPSLILLNVDPRFDAIRGHSRFRDIVVQVGMAT